MNKECILSKKQTIRLSNEPFLLAENEELTFSFCSVGYNLNTAIITLKNGTAEKNYKFKKDFIVPKEFLFAGKLYIKITLYDKGEEIKKWVSMPIKIIETAFDEKELFDYADNLEKRLKDLENIHEII